MSLYPYQQQAVDFHLAHKYSLNFSEMGTGKSRMALEAAKAARYIPLIFGPAFLEGVWEREAAVTNTENFYYVPYTQIRDFSKYSAFNFWVADEVHYLKNPTAQRTEKFYSALTECRPEYFIGLSGTPIRNRLPDIWTLLGFCSLDKSNSNGLHLTGDLRKYHAFSRHFCHTEEIKIAGRKITKYVGVREETLPELKSLLKDKYIKFRVEDVLADLPEMTRIDVPMNLVNVDDRELREVFDAYMAGRKVDSAAKRQSAVLKAPLTVEYVKGLMAGGSGPVLIYSDHIDPAKAIAEGLGNPWFISGGTPTDKRHSAVTAFQGGMGDQSLVATIGSLSVGVTLTAARHVIFNDLSWTPSDNLQAEKRIHRIGQKWPTFSHYITSTPTDRAINKMLLSKLETIEKVTT